MLEELNCTAGAHVFPDYYKAPVNRRSGTLFERGTNGDYRWIQIPRQNLAYHPSTHCAALS